VGRGARAGADQRRRHSDLPGFALQHRANPARRCLLEIVGFWTPDYVTRKRARYRCARLANLVLCIDEERNCARTGLSPGARIVRFRRVDPAAVLQQLADTRPGPLHP
jgi:predicted nuclease of restriction endonuclease-like RecB superfamily